MAEKDNVKLTEWQDRLSSAQSAWNSEFTKMSHREDLYRGNVQISAVVDGDKTKENKFNRNIIAEMIEAAVDTDIPQPQVRAYREEDEGLAKLIEDTIRNEFDRLPMERLNDMAERTTALQGGSLFLVEWDNTQHTHTTVGKLSLTWIHPQMFVPQDGVYTSLDDMDYFFIGQPSTKEAVKRRYGVDVSAESDENSEARGDGGESNDELCTVWIAFYKNESGGIGKFSFVGDTVIEDLPDYQARRTRRCETCGAVEGEMPEADPITPDPMDAIYAGLGLSENEPAAPAEETGDVTVKIKKNVCPFCGGKIKEGEVTARVITEPIIDGDGNVIVDASYTNPVTVPYYTPNVYPVVLLKSVSVHGQLLGISDADALETYQNELDRLGADANDKLLKAGSFLMLPNDAQFERNSEHAKVIRVHDNANAEMTKAIYLEGNIAQNLNYAAYVYEAVKQRAGITDAYLGRKDATATSAVAKEFSAERAAGRLESKRIMKRHEYSKLFEIIFKFFLAYADQPRAVRAQTEAGTKYEEFDQYLFLKRDAAGEYYWNDEFLFSCDAAAPLASNREGLWRETRQNLTDGLLGDRNDPATLEFYWGIMDQLHYPLAGAIKDQITRAKEEAMQAQLEAPPTEPQVPGMMPGMNEGMSAGIPAVI